MAEKIFQPFNSKASPRNTLTPADYASLNSAHAFLALVMSIISGFGKNEEEEDIPPTDDIPQIMGFEQPEEFGAWKSAIVTERLDAPQAAQRIDYTKFDFRAAKKIDVPSAMREHGHPILDLIAEHESNGNYNIAYGGKTHNFTSMTINQVLEWQAQIKADGAPSTAVGRYQFLNTTLSELRDKLHLSGDELFNEAMQDRLAVALLDRRGYTKFLCAQMDEATFMRNISKEWASLPKDAGGLSYYAGDGLNKALTSANSVMAALRETKNNHVPQDRQMEFRDNAYELARHEPAIIAAGPAPVLSLA